MPPPPPVKTADVHAALKQAGQGITRYLFRTWHADSGGKNSKLNSLTRIAPHISKDNGGHESVFDVDGPELTKSMQQHLEYTPGKPTMFSSWYGSLQSALEDAKRQRNAHIAVLDRTQLPKHNNVHWAGSRHLANLGGGVFSEEYLVFGTVSGDVYQALAFEKFKERRKNAESQKR